MKTLAVPGRDLRWAGASMLAAGAVLPLLPGHPGLPCPLRALTGVPCPLCGMSTGVEATVRLHLPDALRANPAAPLLVALVLVLLARRPSEVRGSVPVLALVLAAMWAFELHRFAIW